MPCTYSTITIHTSDGAHHDGQPLHVAVVDGVHGLHISARCVAPGAPIHDCVHLLLSSDFRSLPVVAPAGRPMGIVTQGDLVERAGLPIRLGLLREPDHAGVDDLLHSVEAGEVRGIMSTPVATVQATAAVAGAAYQMAASGLKRLPVVERAGSLVGMLSRIDVLRAITREPMGWGREDARAVTVTEPGYVRDAMERETRTVGPDAPVGDVLHTMSTTGAQRVAVTDDAGRLLGLISDRDLLPILLAPRPPGRIARLVRILGPRASGGGAPSQDEVLARRAGEVMQTALLCVHEDDTIAEAIRVMVEHRLKRLPVVDAEGAFQGMISREAVLRAGMAGSA